MNQVTDEELEICELMADYFEDESSDFDLIETIVKVNNLCQEKMAEIEVLEMKLKEAKDELKRLEQKSLPALMKEAQLTSVELTDGTNLKVEETVKVSLSKAQKPEFFKWCIDNHHSEILKTKFEISIDSGDEDSFDLVSSHLNKIEIDFECNSSVHPQTLNAWAKELLENGNELPNSLSQHPHYKITRKQPKKFGK